MTIGMMLTFYIKCAVGLKGQFEGIGYVVDVVDDLLDVSVGRVFAFNDLNLSLFAVQEAFEKSPLFDEGESDRSD
jgi:hypothetical protein